jgi:hypothetical protein
MHFVLPSTRAAEATDLNNLINGPRQRAFLPGLGYHLSCHD